MGVLTGFYRLSPEALATVRKLPQLLDWVLGYTEDLRDGARLGYNDGARPEQADVDKAWDDILILLAGTDQEAAHRELDIASDPQMPGFEEVRIYTPDAVARGAAALGVIALDHLGELAAQRELRTYDGEPMAEQIDYVVGNLAELIHFWQAAAATGDAIVSSAG